MILPSETKSNNPFHQPQTEPSSQNSSSEDDSYNHTTLSSADDRLKQEGYLSSSDPPGTSAPPPYLENRAQASGLNDIPSSGSSITFYAPALNPSTSTLFGGRPTNTPLSFSRPPSQEATYPSFSPAFLICKGKYLYKGFPHAPPPSASPHPFLTHDVTETDWLRFLNELQKVATLTTKQVELSYLPIVSLIPIVNSLVATGVRTYMKSNKGNVVAQEVDLWNHHFFHPRKINVILMKGQYKLSGQSDIPIPDLHTPQASSVDGPSIVGTKTANQKAADGKGKGKAKEDDKDSYRLFIVPI